MPLKQAPIACVDDLSETARLVDAVNTVLVRAGRPPTRRQHRCAGHGERSSRTRCGPGRGGRGARRWSDGTVGPGRLAQVADAATLYIRTPARAEHLLSIAAALGLTCTVRPWDDRHDGLAAPVVMVTTPVGATDDLADAVPDRPGTLLDVGYHSGPTVLAASWAAAGGAVVGGLDVLAHQAGLQVLLMTGRAVPVTVLRDAGERALAARTSAAD